MAQAKKSTTTQQSTARTVSLADFQKKHAAARADVALLLADIGDGKDTGHGKGMVVIKDPTDLGVGTMRAVLNAGENLVAQGLLAFEALFSEEDFQRLLDADPPMGYVEVLMEGAAEHYGVPSEGESGASLG